MTFFPVVVALAKIKRPEVDNLRWKFTCPHRNRYVSLDGSNRKSMKKPYKRPQNFWGLHFSFQSVSSLLFPGNSFFTRKRAISFTDPQLGWLFNEVPGWLHGHPQLRLSRARATRGIHRVFFPQVFFCLEALVFVCFWVLVWWKFF